MSCPITIYFVKDNRFVGVGQGNLGYAAEMKNTPSAIYEAWHQAVEFFSDDYEELDQFQRNIIVENYSHCFTTREELFEYQFVVIPNLLLIVRRQLVHDLLTSKVSSEQFAEMAENLEFELKDYQWEAITEMSHIHHIKRNLNVDDAEYRVTAKDLIVRMYHWLRTYDPLTVVDPFALDVRDREHAHYVRYMMNWFKGAINPALVSSTLHELL